MQMSTPAASEEPSLSRETLQPRTVAPRLGRKEYLSPKPPQVRPDQGCTCLAVPFLVQACVHMIVCLCGISIGIQAHCLRTYPHLCGPLQAGIAKLIGPAVSQSKSGVTPLHSFLPWQWLLTFVTQHACLSCANAVC